MAVTLRVRVSLHMVCICLLSYPIFPEVLEREGKISTCSCEGVSYTSLP